MVRFIYRKITIICSIIASILLILAFQSIIVFPWFHKVAIGMCFLACIMAIVPMYCQKRFIKAIVGTILSIAGVFFLYILLIIIAPREGHQEFVSPNGSRTIVIEYDHASRPSVYLKYGIFMKKVKTPMFPGTWEVLKYSVEWISEDEVALWEQSIDEPIFIQLD